MMPPSRKPSQRTEYRLLQTQRIDASNSLAEAFPGLKSMSVNLEFFEPTGLMQTGGMKFKPNLKVAKSIVYFNCPSGDCAGGDYDLTENLVRAISACKRSVHGEMRCRGVKHNKETKQSGPCGNVLRYKFLLAYAPVTSGSPRLR